jgi:hypothetical protein
VPPAGYGSPVSRLLTWVLRLLPILGFALIVIGSQEWYPESWLDSKGFVINLASGFTAACFGVPIAFFVLNRLLDDREVRRQRLEVLDLADATVQTIDSFIKSRQRFSEGLLRAIQEFKSIQQVLDDSSLPITTLTHSHLDHMEVNLESLRFLLDDHAGPECAMEARHSVGFLRNDVNDRLRTHLLAPIPARLTSGLEGLVSATEWEGPPSLSLSGALEDVHTVRMYMASSQWVHEDGTDDHQDLSSYAGLVDDTLEMLKSSLRETAEAAPAVEQSAERALSEIREHTAQLRRSI